MHERSSRVERFGAEWKCSMHHAQDANLRAGTSARLLSCVSARDAPYNRNVFAKSSGQGD